MDKQEQAEDKEALYKAVMKEIQAISAKQAARERYINNIYLILVIASAIPLFVGLILQWILP